MLKKKNQHITKLHKQSNLNIKHPYKFPKKREKKWGRKAEKYSNTWKN